MRKQQKVPWYEIRAEGQGEATIYIYDVVGEDSPASGFVKELAAISASTINVRINTPGGSVFDGIAIYNSLKNHPSNVITHIDGLAASMGSIIALAGNEIRMSESAFLMIHNPFGGVAGSAEDMRQMAGMLDKITAQMVSIYATRTKRTPEEIRAWMDAETWFNSEEALASGFIDTVSTAPAIAASFDLSQFHNLPDRLKSANGLHHRKEPEMASTLILPKAENEPASAPVATITPAAPPAEPKAVDPQSADYLAGYQVGYAKGLEDGKAAEKTPAAPPSEATEAAKVGELRAMASDDKDFVFDMLERKATLAQAAAAFIPRMSAQLNTERSARLAAEKALAKETGSPAPVTPARAAGKAEIPEDVDPKTQAKAEWDADPEIRAKFGKQANYVGMRSAQIAGSFRTT